METYTFKVKISVALAVEAIQKGIQDGALTAELIDEYKNYALDGKQLAVLVFDKYFMRNGSRASLTVTIHNLEDTTIVHAAGSGGANGLLSMFDWGASSDFAAEVQNVLTDYII
jgi:hypothetical protein